MFREYLELMAQAGESDGGGTSGTDNKEGQSKPLTEEQIAKILESESGRKAMQPFVDRAVTKGIETWKTNNLEKQINDAVAKATEKKPEESEEQKRFRELEERLKLMETKTTIAENRAAALQTIADKKLPNAFLEVLDYSNTELMTKQLDSLSETWSKTLNESVEKAVTERTGVKPTAPDGKVDNPYKVNPFAKATRNLTLQAKIELENPALAEVLKKEAK